MNQGRLTWGMRQLQVPMGPEAARDVSANAGGPRGPAATADRGAFPFAVSPIQENAEPFTGSDQATSIHNKF
jgi:hypothetical protein